VGLKEDYNIVSELNQIQGTLPGMVKVPPLSWVAASQLLHLADFRAHTT